MLKCPYDNYECGTRQQLALHLRVSHKPHWKGTIAKSIPPGFDIGTPDPRAVAQRNKRYSQTRRTLAYRKGKISQYQSYGKNWYQNLTLEQRKARNERSKELRKARQAAGIKVGKQRWDCPYCDFTTTAQGGKTRHLRAFHPNETGMVELRDDKRPLVERVITSEPFIDRLIKAVTDRIAEAILNGGAK